MFLQVYHAIKMSNPDMHRFAPSRGHANSLWKWTKYELFNTVLASLRDLHVMWGSFQAKNYLRTFIFK